VSAIVNKGYLLRLVQDTDGALGHYDRAIRDFDDAPEPSIQEHVLRAIVNKAFLFGQRHEIEQTKRAIQIYEEATGRFRKDMPSSWRQKMTLAFNGLGFQRLLLAKWSLGHPGSGADSKQILLQAREAIAHALELTPDVPMVIGNQAYIEFLLGERSDFARERLNRAIELGGEETRQGELRDTQIHPIPQDAVFAAWIHAASGQINEQKEAQ
jgi:tetratricopeptide (TPR) repeat protein